MKILGHTGIKPRLEVVELGESLDDGSQLEVTLKAPRLNTIDRINEEIRVPEPPEPPAGAVMRDNRGRVMTDAEGRAMVERNWKDLGFLKKRATYELEVDRVKRAQGIALLIECLDGQIETQAQRSDYVGEDGGPGKAGSLVDYCHAVWEEFESFGLSLVALNRLLDAAMRLAGLRDDELAEAKAALGESGN